MLLHPNIQHQRNILARVRPTIVMVGAVGLALKDHGRGRTLQGLCGGAPRVVSAPVVGQPDP